MRRALPVASGFPLLSRRMQALSHEAGGIHSAAAAVPFSSSASVVPHAPREAEEVSSTDMAVRKEEFSVLKAIIVDDEAPARSELRFLLGEMGQVDVVAEAASVREAIDKLKEYPCDVMFLDVNMPEATGLRLAEGLQHLKFPPQVVFVTAYSEFALDAFKVNAVDYLVKPVETERLRQAIARVRENVVLHAQAQRSERIPVEKAGKKILIAIDKIRFIMARDDYAYLQTDSDRYFSTVSLAQLEKRLEGHGFFRVHRGYLVNLSMVEEVESVAGGTLLLTLNGVEDTIPVSRRRVSTLKKALGI